MITIVPEKTPARFQDYNNVDMELDKLLVAYHNNYNCLSCDNVGQKEIDDFCDTADKFLSDNQFKQAYELFKKVCFHDCSNKRGWMGLGACCNLTSKSEQAISFYSCAAEIDREDPYPLFCVCNCYLGLRAYQEAQQALDEVIARCGTNPKHAQLKERSERVKTSIKIVRPKPSLTAAALPKALEKPTVTLEDTNAVLEFWEKEKSEGEKQHLLFRKKVTDQTEPFYIQRGLSKEKLEELYALAYDNYEKKIYREARRLFAVSANYNHLDKRGWMALGAALAQTGNQQLAIKAYSAASHLDPKDELPYLYTSLCWRILGNKSKALEAAGKVMKSFEDDELNVELDRLLKSVEHPMNSSISNIVNSDIELNEDETMPSSKTLPLKEEPQSEFFTANEAIFKELQQLNDSLPNHPILGRRKGQKHPSKEELEVLEKSGKLMGQLTIISFEDSKTDAEMFPLVKPFFTLSDPAYLSSTLTKKEVEGLLSAAQKYLSENKWEKALGLFKEVLHYNHLNQQGWIGLAKCYQHFKKFKQAVFCYGCSILFDATDPEIYFAAYECFHELQEDHDALGALEYVLMTSQDKPSYVELHNKAEKLKAPLKLVVQKKDEEAKKLPFFDQETFPEPAQKGTKKHIEGFFKIIYYCYYQKKYGYALSFLKNAFSSMLTSKYKLKYAELHKIGEKMRASSHDAFVLPF